jgi:hypothetical protein
MAGLLPAQKWKSNLTGATLGTVPVTSTRVTKTVQISSAGCLRTPQLGKIIPGKQKNSEIRHDLLCIILAYDETTDLDKPVSKRRLYVIMFNYA